MLIKSSSHAKTPQAAPASWLHGRSLWVLGLSLLAVMLFSLEHWQWPAAYLGFDMALVVAGYLALNYCLRQAPGTWQDISRSLLQAWQYLLNRYVAIIAILLPLGIWMLLPQELARLYRDIAASGLLVSNLTAWADRAFLYGSVQTSALGHTWLVSLIAQFLVMTLVLHRLAPARMLPVFIAGALASLVITLWAAGAKPSAGFYLPVTRLWPFALGAMTALLAADKRISEKAGLLFTAGGLALVVFAIGQPGTYPDHGIGIQAAAILGTCLMLAPGGTALPRHRVLLSALLTLFLAHHPLVALLKTLGAGRDALIVLILLGLVLSVLLVHGLLYRRLSLASNWRFKPATWIAPFLVLAVAGWGMSADGKILRQYPDSIFSLQTIEDSPCYGTSDGHPRIGEHCVLGGPQARLALVGDAHAATLFNPLQSQLQGSNIGFRAVAGPYCAPLFDFANLLYSDRGCARTTSRALEEIIAEPAIETVALYAQWANYTQGSRDGNPPSPVSYRGQAAASPEENPALFAIALEQTVQRLVAAGKHVVLVTPTPEFELRVQDERARNWLLGSQFTPPRMAVSAYELRNRDVLDEFARQAGNSKITILEAQNLFCEKGLCESMSPDGQVLFSDNTHLAGQGAERLAQHLLEVIRSQAPLRQEAP